MQVKQDYTRIPTEMRHYHQWVVWRYEERQGAKPTKIPYDARNGLPASVTDASTWCDFETAIKCQSANIGFDGIGFVLTKNDPYTFIDLDDTAGNQVNLDRQLKIYHEFNSYSELSPSGTGLHIIIKGHIPRGRRRSAIELYSSDRYMTMTGAVYNDKPIVERQSLLQMLWAQMGSDAAESIYDKETLAIYSDSDIVEQAISAVNGEKFKSLLEGRWTDYYQSQSEADFAFIDMVAFYTQNKAQIARIFRESALGQRDKAKRNDYVDRMILRSFDRQLPPIDLTGLQSVFDQKINEVKNISGVTPPVAYYPPQIQNISGDTLAAQNCVTEIRNFWQPTEILPPPGLLGDMARFIYDASPRPVVETAICAAIGMLSGIIGRAYNVSGTGLNMYMLLLAPTGTGKEAMASGINKLFSSIKTTVPASADFRGPAEIASGQALLKTLSNPKKCCFVSIVGEFGLKMQQLASSRASSSELMLKRVLLDLYNKSGQKDILAASVYAQKENNTEEIRSPAVTILGESTPETFYSALDEGMIADGLLPRFTIIEYKGKRPPRNKNHEMVEPNFNLVQKLAEVTEYCLMMMQASRVINVGCTREAMDFLDKVDTMVDAAINETTTDVLRHLWNRAHIKTLKIAAIEAVGNNFTHPVIDLEMAQWAYNLVSIDIVGIVARFSRGEIGKNSDENKQSREMMRICLEFMMKDYQAVKNYGVDESLHKQRVIPHCYISRRLSTKGIYKTDKMGATYAINRTIKALIDAGDIQEVGRSTMVQNFAYKGRAFILTRSDMTGILDDD